MASGLTALFFSDYRRRVLELLLLHPDQSYHVREIARLTGTVPGTLHRELSRLAEAGVLLKQRAGNQVLYQANRDGLIFDELASILRKTAERNQDDGMQDENDKLVIDESVVVSRAALLDLAKRFHIRRLGLFGSAARGKLTPESDIDLLVEFEPEAAPSLWAVQELQDDFVRLFGGRPVDIVSPEVLRNPYRRKTIERDLKVLYDAA